MTASQIAVVAVLSQKLKELPQSPTSQIGISVGYSPAGKQELMFHAKAGGNCVVDSILFDDVLSGKEGLRRAGEKLNGIVTKLKTDF